MESLAPILMKNRTSSSRSATSWPPGLRPRTSTRAARGPIGSSGYRIGPACRRAWIARGRNPILIPHPFVAVVGGIQPDVLSVLADPRGRTDGFLDRILFTYPDARPAPDWTWDDIPEEVLAPWRQTVQALFDLNMEPGANGPRPFLVGLTLDARPRWQALMDSLIHEMNDPDFPTHPAQPVVETEGLHGAALAHPPLPSVREQGGGHAERGRQKRPPRSGMLISYFKSHARKVLAAALDADPKAAAAEHADRPARNRHLNDFTRADLYQLVRGSFKTPEDLDAPLNVLTVHQYLHCYTPTRPQGTRGANPPRYQINPLWDCERDAEITGITGTGIGDERPAEDEIPVIPD